MTTRRNPIVPGWSMVAIAIAILLLSSVLSSQSDSPARSGVVVLRVLLPESVVCVGERTVHAEAELRNVGSQGVSLVPDGIGSGIHFQAYGASVDKLHGVVFRSSDAVGDAWPQAKAAKTVTLEPGESYRTVGTVSLDPKFFSEPGIYKVSIDYSGRAKLPPSNAPTRVFDGEITSNWVYFEVQECDASTSR